MNTSIHESPLSLKNTDTNYIQNQHVIMLILNSTQKKKWNKSASKRTKLDDLFITYSMERNLMSRCHDHKIYE